MVDQWRTQGAQLQNEEFPTVLILQSLAAGYPVLHIFSNWAFLGNKPLVYLLLISLSFFWLLSCVVQKMFSLSSPVVLCSPVSEVDSDSVTLSDGRVLPCGLVVWSTGLAPRWDSAYSFQWQPTQMWHSRSSSAVADYSQMLDIPCLILIRIIALFPAYHFSKQWRISGRSKIWNWKMRSSKNLLSCLCRLVLEVGI